MGFIGSLFSGDSGAGYQPQSVQGLPGFTQAINGGQLAQGYNQNQAGIAQQQQFLNALFANNMGALGQQNQLANQLASGQGAAQLAQAQLAQNTGNNMRQQAALMAGARGAGSNPGLVSRQAAMAMGPMQQQAAGQAATLQAQTALAQQQQLAELNNSRLGQLQGGLNAYNQAAANNYGMGLNAAANQNAQVVGMQSNLNNVGGGIAQGNQQFQGGFLNHLLFNQGGMVPQEGAVAKGYADGGEVDGGPTSILGKYLQSAQTNSSQIASPQTVPVSSNVGMGLLSKATGTPESESGGLGLLKKGSSQLGGLLGGGAGEAGGEGAGLAEAFAMSPGGKVPGHAEVKGDSTQNDTVPAMLSAGEIVIPRSHVHDAKKTAAFLNHLMGWKLKA